MVCNSIALFISHSAAVPPSRQSQEEAKILQSLQRLEEVCKKQKATISKLQQDQSNHIERTLIRTPPSRGNTPPKIKLPKVKVQHMNEGIKINRAAPQPIRIRNRNRDPLVHAEERPAYGRVGAFLKS